MIIIIMEMYNMAYAMPSRVTVGESIVMARAGRMDHRIYPICQGLFLAMNETGRERIVRLYRRRHVVIILHYKKNETKKKTIIIIYFYDYASYYKTLCDDKRTRYHYYNNCNNILLLF